MKRNKKLDSIVFISVPEEFEHTVEDFRINPSILLPVEIPEGPEHFNPSELSWEMILSGMLKVIGYDEENPDVEYYRDFVLSLKPDIVRELSSTGIIKAEQKDFDLAEEIFLILSKLLPDDPSSTINMAFVCEERAHSYERIGNEETQDEYMNRAFDCYRTALGTWPDSPDVLYHAGQFYLRNSNFQKAASCFTSFLAFSSDEERNEEVRKVLDTIKTRDLSDSLFSEAFDYIKLGKEEEGIERILRFMEKNGDVWNAWFLLGWAQRRLEKYDEARTSFEKALSLNPSHVDTLNELSICTMELGDFASSGKYLREALAIEPENVKIISNLGILALKENKTREAEGFFQAVLVNDPDDQVALHYLEYIKSISET